MTVDDKEGGADEVREESEATTPKDYRLNPEQFRELNRAIRRRKLQDALKKFLEETRIGWLLHPAPFDAYFRDALLPTGLEAARARFIRRFSWYSLLRKRNERTYQLGLGGIVLAPLVSWIVLHIGHRAAHAFPLQLGVLYLSGVAYVIACALVAWRCPLLTREVTEHHKGYDPDREVLWRALIEDELRGLLSVRRYPIDVAFLTSRDSAKAMKARQFYQGGIVPYQSGFGSLGRHRIEEALVAAARDRGIRVYEESRRGGALSSLGGPGKMYEGAEPYVETLEVRLANEDDLNRIQPSDEFPTEPRSASAPPSGSGPHIVLRWYERSFELRKDAVADCAVGYTHFHGLHDVYASIGVERLAHAVAQWQGHRHLASRLLISALYAISVVAFAAFLAVQSWTVWQATAGALG